MTNEELQDWLTHFFAKNGHAGHFFRWDAGEEFFTYGWCTTDDNLKDFTYSISNAKQLNFYAFRLSAKDITKATTDVKLTLQPDIYFFAPGNPTVSVMVEVRGCNRFCRRGIKCTIESQDKVRIKDAFIKADGKSYFGTSVSKDIDDCLDLVS